MLNQRTLKNSIRATGVGLHTGGKVLMVLRPAPVDSGVTFIRTDLDEPATGLRCQGHLAGADQATRGGHGLLYIATGDFDSSWRLDGRECFTLCSLHAQVSRAAGHGQCQDDQKNVGKTFHSATSLGTPPVIVFGARLAREAPAKAVGNPCLVATGHEGGHQTSSFSFDRIVQAVSHRRTW
jgi:hypothetical protein